MAAPRAHRTAPDGSPYPDRADPSFERDVRAMFDAIADGYDTFDHVASLGQDILWRPRALWALDRFRRGKPKVLRALDVGCGTGDLTRLTARHLPKAEVTGIDFTGKMVAIASARTFRRSERRRVGYGRASALRLPFRTGMFDLVLSAFVVRNLPRLNDAFQELRRVLTTGGTLLTLEITEPSNPRVARLFHGYFDAVVPWLGTAIGRSGPYRYLPESLRHLPPRSEMLERLGAAGFGPVQAVAQSGGIVTTYLAEASGERR